MEREFETPEAREEREEEEREEDAAWIAKCIRRVPELRDFEREFRRWLEFLQELEQQDADDLADDLEQCAYHLRTPDVYDTAGWIEDEHGGAVYIEWVLSPDGCLAETDDHAHETREEGVMTDRRPWEDAEEAADRLEISQRVPELAGITARHEFYGWRLHFIELDQMSTGDMFRDLDEVAELFEPDGLGWREDEHGGAEFYELPITSTRAEARFPVWGRADCCPAAGRINY
jgi:hypothetical protein